ncbi:MAG: ATP synthase F1 subunit gamma [Phycisphaerae bacterium]
MAKAREITKRRKAVRNIYKITRVMQMVATARFQRALKRAKGTRPYLDKLDAIVKDTLLGAQGSAELQRHPLLASRTPCRRTAILVVTSNRGLAGGYNSQILRVAMQNIRQLEEAGQQVDIHVAGRKGAAYFRFARREVKAAYTGISDNATFEEVLPVAQALMDDFANQTVDAIKIVYMRFISVGQQKATTAEVLPVQALEIDDSAKSRPSRLDACSEYSPDAGELLVSLVPTMVRATTFQAFVDASVSEQIARMMAMSAATENADSMIKHLTREYNRARQSQITSELSELMGGVEALK